jgi:hypothetical protein
MYKVESSLVAPKGQVLRLEFTPAYKIILNNTYYAKFVSIKSNNKYLMFKPIGIQYKNKILFSSGFMEEFHLDCYIGNVNSKEFHTHINYGPRDQTKDLKDELIQLFIYILNNFYDANIDVNNYTIKELPL